jgi:sterol desaturase/sphingolipid hydroxylase (fatty acid hydroxylase superfamily)
MFVLLISLVLGFIATNLFGFVVHWALHRKESKDFNQSHMTHHEKLYPPEDFFSDVYRDAGKDATPKFFVIAAIPMLLSVVFFWLIGVISLFVCVVVMLEMIGIGLIDNYLHDAFHIRNHWLNRVPLVRTWYAKLVKYHYLHHCDMTRNYGIFNFMWDRIFKRFWDKTDFEIPEKK